jgi:hypothetical protein
LVDRLAQSWRSPPIDAAAQARGGWTICDLRGVVVTIVSFFADTCYLWVPARF